MEIKFTKKVLTVSINAWRDNTGINTLINFFKNCRPNYVAQVYTRGALPDTEVCNNFFQIPESAVIKSLINRKILTGRVVENSHEQSDNNNLTDENKLYSRKNLRFSHLLSIFREIVWFFGKWKTEELNKFVDEFSPDILFIPIYPTVYMGRIQKYIIERTGKPVVSYIADDNYSYKAVGKNPLALIHRFILRPYVRYIIKASEQVLVIAPKQKEEYDRLFSIDSEVLTKGIDFSDKPYVEAPIHNPIKMVYTGKLIIGRWKSLAEIARAMGEINADGEKVTLDIYTTDSLSKEQEKLLNRNGSRVRGAVSLEEVRKIQENSDILIFVESLDKKYKNAARLSFSTKLTDYLSAGKCVFAVGARDIAPIDYLNRNECAVTACDYSEILPKLSELVSDSDKIIKYSKAAYDCALKNHSDEHCSSIFVSALNNALK